MQIVIDIPEELKNKIDNANEDNYRAYLWWFETTLYYAIKNGTPLPEGHGKLKDVDHYIKMQWEHSDYSLTDDEPTIIEADKAVKE